ncbi:MAG: tagatose 1,6-diphosphate aldolase [Alphaproteobacteria bacterium]
MNKQISLTPGKLWSMRRLANDKGHFKMLAVDQRPPIKAPIAAHHKGEAPWGEVGKFKASLISALQGETTAVLLDPHFAVPAAMDITHPHKGLIITLEDSNFQTDQASQGRSSSQIDDWDVGKIKRMGGDAVKVLTWYHPNAPAKISQHQQDYTKRIGEACAHFDIPFLLEMLAYPLAGDKDQTRDYVEMKQKNADIVLETVHEFAKDDYMVDIFKLESPLNAADIPSFDSPDAASCQALFDEMGKLAGRPWVMLSAGASQQQFTTIMRYAYQAGASGFLAGRAIWQEAFKAYPDWTKIEQGLTDNALPYLKTLNALTDQSASNWQAHPCYGADGDGARFSPKGAEFRHHYPSL